MVDRFIDLKRGAAKFLSLRWDQVDWDANLIRVGEEASKGKQARVGPIYGELRAWFEMAFAKRDPKYP